MDESAVKESRVFLRLIQDHLLADDLQAGAVQESAGMVDVVTHRTQADPALNYVLPRRNTAWVPTPTIDAGLQRLRDQGHAARFQYVQGLFPPQFGDTLTKIALTAESEQHIMAFHRNGIGGRPRSRPATGTSDAHIRRVSAKRAARIWAMTDDWRMLLGGRRAADADGAFDVVAYRHRKPLGILRVEIQASTGTAQLVALALADGTDKQTTSDLLGGGIRRALRHGGDLIFALADDAAVDALAALQFIEIGQFKRYTGAAPTPEQDNTA